MVDAAVKASRLSEEQKAAVVNAIFERVKIRDYGQKAFHSVIAMLFSLAILTSGTLDSIFNDTKWALALVNTGLIVSVVLSVYFLYKLFCHLFSYKRRKDIAKEIGCDPEAFSTHEVILYILHPMIKQGKWRNGIGEQFKA